MSPHRRSTNARVRLALISTLILLFLPIFLSVWSLPVQARTPGQNRPRPQAGSRPDTSYLAGMPSVEKVENLIQGTDPTDTLARQVAIFNVLPSLIERMGMEPSRRYGDTTPDESKVSGSYRLAAYQLTQEYAKSHSADELKAFNQLHG